MHISRNLFVSTYSFLLGMYIIKIKCFQWWHAALGLVLSAFWYCLPAISANQQTLFANLSAYFLFVVLAYIGQKVTNITMQKIFAIVGKYSYAVFLVHHYLIMKTLSTFQNQTYGIVGTGLLYLTCWGQIIIFAKLLYMVNNSVLKALRKEKMLRSCKPLDEI